MTDSSANLAAARAYLHEAHRRRHAHASRAFYWTLLRWAQNARQRAAQGDAGRAEPQRQLALWGAP